MTDNTKPSEVRLKSHFWFYDDRRHCSREFLEGSVVSDPADIEWLLSIGAPIEPAIFRR
jgi:hypothetical protein